MWKWNSVFGVRITFCAHAHTQNTSCPAVVHATHIFRLFFCYLCTFWSYNEQNSMFKKQSLWCQKIENLLPTCLMCRHTTYRMHDRPDRADCERHLCIFFLVDVRDKWSSFDMNIPTWTVQSGEPKMWKMTNTRHWECHQFLDDIHYASAEAEWTQHAKHTQKY